MARDGQAQPVIGHAQEIETADRGAGPAQEEQPGADWASRVWARPPDRRRAGAAHGGG
ncbi:hypothetical protein ACVXHA_21500 [Escherichia coli]